jgi:hypothetical protein
VTPSRPAGASRCSPGFYSLKGSRKPCQQCPFGRTTANDASRQRLFTDCYVKPGFGLVSSTGESTDHTGFIADASSVADDVAAVMTVLECPIGYYGAGLSIRSTCVPCPVGSTTEELGRTAVSQCSGKVVVRRRSCCHLICDLDLLLRTQAPCWRHVLVNFLADLSTCKRVSWRKHAVASTINTGQLQMCICCFLPLTLQSALLGMVSKACQPTVPPVTTAATTPVAASGARSARQQGSTHLLMVQVTSGSHKVRGAWCVSSRGGGGCLIVYREEGDGQAAASPSAPCRRVPCAALMVQATCRAMPWREDSL